MRLIIAAVMLLSSRAAAASFETILSAPVVQPVSFTSGTAITSVTGSTITAFQGGSWTVTTTPPASQAVTFSSGSASNPFFVQTASTFPVSVSALPAITGTVGVSNFPATQPISTISTLPVSGTFWQATQPISGTVGVSNFPATQPVSTVSTFPVSGTFWQATQPISAVSLPLPTGAATDRPVQIVTVNIDSTTAANPTFVRSNSTIPVSGIFNQGSYTITMGSGTITVAFSSGSFSNALYVLSTGTVISTGSITSFQGGSWTLSSSSSIAKQDGSYTVTPGTGVFSMALASGSFVNPFYTLSTNTIVSGSTVTLAASSVNVGTVNGSTIAVVGLAGAAIPVSLASLPSGAVTNAGTFAVQATQAGSYTMTFGTGTVQVVSTNTVLSAGTSDVGVVHLSTASTLVSTSGVIGSVSLGNTVNKTMVFVSSFAATAAIGSQIVLSSRVTTSGQTFYLQRFEANAYEAAATTSTIGNMGSMAIFSPTSVAIASKTFVYSGTAPPPWIMEFAEAIPIPSGRVFASSVTANTATSIEWSTIFWGYEK